MEDSDQIVITGISGRFPQCENIEEFREALLNGVDLVTENNDRYPAGIYGVPKRSGVVLNIDKFDSSYFGILPKQATFMDPRQRILLEVVYEAIVDAGYNPKELRGTHTGVYVGLTGFSNSEALRQRDDTDGYTNIGLNPSIAANRTSYCFDFQGPSYVCDTACSSSLVAFVNAINDFKAGLIDNAVVCGTHLQIHPHETLEFLRLNMLSPDGKCMVFSTERNGYVRSETVACYLLQKKQNSRRIYATVLGAKSNNDGYKKEGITFPSAQQQFNLLNELYLSAKVNPNEISYLEAHGTGTPVGDNQECQAITEHFCKNRKGPLTVGAVKSNMGHSEMASGLCSMTKAILANETGIIPANLHAESIDKTLPGICDNKIQVVTKNTKWNGGLMAVNCFGFGGTNAHIILNPYSKDKTNKYRRPKHRLVQVSGRTEEAVLHFLEKVQENQDDPEFLALVDEIHKINMDSHNYRGYTVLGKKPVKELGRAANKRPIWFVYSGMGSQWTKMGKDLMDIKVFRSTIIRCAAALKPYNVDLIDILTSEDPKVLDNITSCFCAIGCIEIALTDVLSSLGIVPDGIAGHSLGEVGCAYADGTITPEQATLLAYARGHGTQNSKIELGQMAAIGLSAKEVKKILPEDVYLACQNSSTSVTISGGQAATKAFVEQLTSQGVFARLVKSGDIAFHTKYVAEAGNLLLDFCKDVLKNPKPRSKKWISSSVPLASQNQTWTQYNCAEYHYNNFCSPVLFDQVYEHIPDDAIVIEVAPHGLLQAILKRELSQSTNISLVNRASEDNEQFFLSALGKIFLAGGQPNLRELYNDVSFPVSRGTKMLAPLVKWDHSVSWYTPLFENQDSFGKKVVVSLSDQKYAHLEGHEIDGRVLMPATGYLELVWQVAAEKQLKQLKDVAVVFENVHLMRATVLSFGEGVTFLINITKQSGHFEIFESGSVVCKGTIRNPKEIASEFVLKDLAGCPKSGLPKMSKENIYKECHLRKYLYKDMFQGMAECDVEGLAGKIEWKGNFGSFLDTMLHLSVIHETGRDLMLPTFILKAVLDPSGHLKIAEKENVLDICFDPELRIIKTGKIELIGLETSKAPRRQNVQVPPTLETYDFIYYETSVKNQYDFDTALRISTQIILQNHTGMTKELKICEIVTSEVNQKINQNIKTILDNQPFTDIEYFSEEPEGVNKNYDLLVVNEDVLPSVDVNQLVGNLNENGFILYKGNYDKIGNTSLQIIFQAVADEDSLYLLRPKYEFPKNYSAVNIGNSDFDWIEKIKSLVRNEKSEVVYLLSQDEDTTGIMGFMLSFLKEPINLKFKAIFIDQSIDKFSTEDEFYRDQLKKNLTFNVLKKNNWGTYVHLPLKEIEKRNVGNAAVGITTPGDLSTLTWIERPFEGISLPGHGEQVYVYYSALNFKDVMSASGKLLIAGLPHPTAPEINMGMEYSGVTQKGKRVMGILGCESMALQTSNDPYLTWEVPREWSLKDAATVPCVYATCYYGMIMRGQLQPGESILIHAGTGGIGIASINIALSMGCQVFTTVGSTEKREFVKKLFPQIDEDHIGNSRDATFETLIKVKTKGRGVDVVLNSLAGHLFQASMRCLAERGRFLEIGKVDLLNSSPIPSKMFLKNISFHGVHLDGLFYPHCEAKREVQYLLAEGIAMGVVKPLPNVVYDETQIESAFRFLASGKHKGKVLIEMRREEVVPFTAPIRSISAVPKIYFDRNKSYVLVGGLGGFGLELTDWLIRKGATKIVLNSRRGVTDGYQSYCLRKWGQYKGIDVRIDTSDTTTTKGAENLINFSNELGPVGGIFNMAVVLKDALLVNQTRSNYEQVFRTKIISGGNMDKISRILCKDLDHFVVFSTIACGRGNAGQTNYAMANSALERLCEKRRRERLPGLAVQWGPIGEVGVLTKMEIDERMLKNIQYQKIASCLNSLETFMLQPCAVGASTVICKREDSATQQTTRSPVEAVSHILGINNLELVDKTMSLSQLGLDSLMGTEIKQTLYRHFQIELSPEEIRDLTLNALIAMDGSETEEKTNVNPEVEAVTQEIISYLLEDEVVLKMNSASSTKNVFLLHPIEGHVNILKPLARKLKATVYGFQATSETQCNTIDELAKFYIQKLRQIQPKGPYSVCGYSYGGSLGLEISLQLEKCGEKVDLITIDASPIIVQHILKAAHMRVDQSVEQSQQNSLITFASSFPEADQTQISKALKASTNWNQRLENVGEIISKATGINRTKISQSAASFFQRIYASYHYEPATSFAGRILLIRREDNPFFLSDDYDLQKVCKQPVTISKLKGTHTTILLGENTQKVADTINKFFDL